MGAVVVKLYDSKLEKQGEARKKGIRATGDDERYRSIGKKQLFRRRERKGEL